MGVKDLWPILEPCSEKKSLDDLSGSKVAVDLGFWVCEMKAAVQNPNVINTHLRNLFFRIWALVQRDIVPIFVTEGIPPEVKQQTIQSRQFYRKQDHANIKPADCGGKVMKRTKFDAILKECCSLITNLGLPFIESDGEAEAFCAALNYSGVVDAVITDDGDAFLYGAKTVYRNFNLEGMIDCYKMEVIEETLNLNRNNLVGLALLLGCDYCPKGVPGVGKENVMKFFQDVRNIDLLDRFKSWRMNSEINILKSEEAIRKKALKVDGFPDSRVITEFLRPRDLSVILQKEFLEWKMPNLLFLHQFLSQKLEWQSNYIISKVVPFITLWNLKQTIGNSSSSVVSIQKVLRQTTKSKIDVYEVQWLKLNCDTWTDKDFYITLELKRLIDVAFPELVAEFVETKSKKKRKGAKKKTETCTALSVEEAFDKSAVLFDGDNWLDMENKENFSVNELTSRIEKVAIQNDVVNNVEIEQLDNLDHLDEPVGVSELSDSPLPLSKRLQLLLPGHQNSLLLKK